MDNTNIIHESKLDLDFLKSFIQKPEPFAPGEELFWDDPHISKGMLEAHLNPGTNAASRKPEIIDKTVKNLITAMNLKQGDKILDLGCGPGLYCKDFAQLGFTATGLDYSKRSVEYAKCDAAGNGLNIDYKYMNYLHMDYTDEFDAVTLIYGDLCVLSDKNRDLLLKKIHMALKPGGYFTFDVTTRVSRKKNGLKNRWYVVDSGFWKPGSHLVLENGFDYPEEGIFLDQYIVIEDSGKVSVYRNWFHDYALEEISEILNCSGFSVQQAWSDLSGEPYNENAEWIGVVTRKR
jgi:Methylase involved in ubiquinone/menaquinone biosynthesis